MSNLVIRSKLASIMQDEQNHYRGQPCHTLTRLWNPAKEAQATDRVYRIGQDKPVFVYYPISSYDESKREIFESEHDYVDCFVNQSTVEKSPEVKLNRVLVRKKRILNNFFWRQGTSTLILPGEESVPEGVYHHEILIENTDRHSIEGLRRLMVSQGF